MKILSVHNEYLLRGGEEESRKAETLIMEKYGHEITYYTEYNSAIKELSNVNSALRTIWSQESYKKVQAVLDKDNHDVMHVQNFFPLISPSVYYAAKSRNVPVVQAIRNYRIICPACTLYRDGKICEDCVGKTIPYPGTAHKCYRDDVGASLAATSMLAIHNLANSWKHVDVFVAVSDFVKQKLIQGGFAADKIVVKPNFVFPDPGANFDKEDYIVFVGRLQKEKGILNLMEAVAALNDRSIKLKIIGKGPLIKEVLTYTSLHTNIEYLGELPLEETYDIIGKAKFLIIPSVWHEPFGRVIAEAYAKGTPVVGSNVGGIPELIRNQQTGLIYQADDKSDLSEKITWMFAHPNEVKSMGLEARQEFLKKYTPEINYKMLMDIYNSVIK